MLSETHISLLARCAGVALSLLSSTACTPANLNASGDSTDGSTGPRSRAVEVTPAGSPDFYQEVQPILNRRCVVCHGCWDAPCQLKLGAIEGIDRGATPKKIYDPSRLVSAAPTRLFQDASSTAEWRSKEFHPVLNEGGDSPAAHRAGSVLYQMLRLKREHPQAKGGRLEDFDFSIDRDQVCPTIEKFAEYESEHPLWGMPYGLPAVSDEEFGVLEGWIDHGSLYVPPPDMRPNERMIAIWEELLNQPTKKSRLIARYLFEHLFLAHLFFEPEAREETKFYRLVRSRTGPGHPVAEIASRRPYDPPGTEAFFYRLLPLRTPVLVKNHLPYRFDDKRMRRFKEIFYDAEFEVTKLPGYAQRSSANPFATFGQLPEQARYRFLLDDSRFFLDGFIKGPVCRGQASLNVINDRFWVFFLDPRRSAAADDARFWAGELHRLDLPGVEENSVIALSHWLRYSREHKRLLDDRAAFLRRKGAKTPVDLALILGGEAKLSGAALTVLRHEDSATVVEGLVGTPPKTSWVLGYGTFERIHYLLVAGFDVFGNVGHQLDTRMYMDFLRMEAEAEFLRFLPRDARRAVRDKWYEGAEKEASKFIVPEDPKSYPETAIEFQSMNPELEFYQMLRRHVGPAASTSFALKGDKLETTARRLAQVQGGAAALMPELSFVRIVDPQGSEFVTLLRDDYHTNILSIFSEEKRRRPAQDQLTLARGLLGAYPNALFSVRRDQWDAFIGQLLGIRSEQDFSAFRDRFGVLRTDPDFWEYSDELHAFGRTWEGQPAGLFDYNRLQAR